MQQCLEILDEFICYLLYFPGKYPTKFDHNRLSKTWTMPSLLDRMKRPIQWIELSHQQNNCLILLDFHDCFPSQMI
jgi:hypothetical protein